MTNQNWTEVDAEVALEVGSHEACIRPAYKDSVSVWTWSVGLTSATGHDVTRYIGKPQSIQHCMNVYIWALDRYADQVRDVFAGHKLTKAQFAAALSFHWNTGAIRRATWVKKWKAGDISGARKSFMNWTTPKSITARRRKERDLFFSGKWSNDGTMTEYTRLTSRHTPVWSSARKINVEKEIANAFADRKDEAAVDSRPEPLAVPAGSTISPSGFWVLIAKILSAVAGASKAA